MRVAPWQNAGDLGPFVAAAEMLVETCLAEGITLFDHADIYGGGACESVFGRVLERHPDWRDRMILQSKCSIRFEPVHRFDASAAYIEASVDGILRRLRTDRLDVLLLHRPDPLLDPDEVAGAFSRLRDAGKVLHFGVSNFTAGQMRLLASRWPHPLVANQIQLSLMHPWPITEGVFADRTDARYAAADGLLDHCRVENVQVQAWSPVAGGALSVSREGDGERERAVREAVANAAQALGITPDAVGIAWLLRHPGGIVPILGTTKPARVREAATALRAEMSSNVWWDLFRASLGRKLP